MASSAPQITPAGGGELRCGPGNTCTWFMATGDAGTGSFALVEEQAAAGEAVPLHRHDADDESFYVLNGEVTFYVGSDPGRRVGPGAFVHVPGGTTHGFRVEVDRTRYLIWTTARHGSFYRAITTAVGAVGEPFVPVSDEEIGRACAEFGIEYIGALPEG